MTPDDNLIRMANQIGVFFESMTDRDEALEGIATHLKRFWDPRMRQAFLARVEGNTAPEVRPIVRDAIQAYRALIV